MTYIIKSVFSSLLYTLGALPGGMPLKAMVGTDTQSDAQAAQMANPAHFKGEWDEPGVLMVHFTVALILSPFNAWSMYIEVEEAFYNVMTGYYLVIINIMELEEEWGKDWWQHYQHEISLGNLLSNAGNFVVRAIYWCKKMPFNPDKTRELKQEQHYGRIKEAKLGSNCAPSHADLIVGTSLVHLAQLDKINEFGRQATPRYITPIKKARALQLAKSALRTACKTFACWSMNKRAKALYEKLPKWYAAGGHRHIINANAVIPDSFAEDMDPDAARGEEHFFQALRGPRCSSAGGEIQQNQRPRFRCHLGSLRYPIGYQKGLAEAVLGSFGWPFSTLVFCWKSNKTRDPDFGAILEA